MQDTEQTSNPTQELLEDAQLIPTSDRNKQIFKDYTSGIPVSTLVNKYNLSNVRIYAIVKRESSKNGISKEYEKTKRVTTLQRIADRIPKNLTPDNVSDAIKVLEQQRKELEDNPTPQSIGTNVQINIENINSLASTELVESIRKLLGN